jgi:hypothetical protein
MNGMTAFSCVSDMDLDLIEESMKLFSSSGSPVVGKRRYGSLGRFLSSGWGVAVICAVVSLSVLAVIIRAGQNPPILPPIPGTEETETAAEETEAITEVEEMTAPENESGTLPPEGTDTGDVTSEETASDTTEETTLDTEGERYPNVTEGGIVFISNGDGTCKVKGADKNHKGKLIVPSVSPYGDTVTAVAGGAFRSFSSLTEVELPDTVTALGSSAFQGCGALTSVKLPPAVTEFGGSMFNGCGELLHVDLPAGLTEIPGMTFQTCVNLRSVTIQDGITSIGANAFNGCRSLSSLTIPAGLKSIRAQAFLNCCGLGFVYYRGSREEWEQVDIDETGNSFIVNRTVRFIE